MAEEQHSEEVQRWTAKRRAALIISLLKGETTTAEAARRHGLTVDEVFDLIRFYEPQMDGRKAKPAPPTVPVFDFHDDPVIDRCESALPEREI